MNKPSTSDIAEVLRYPGLNGRLEAQSDTLGVVYFTWPGSSATDAMLACCKEASALLASYQEPYPVGWGDEVYHVKNPLLVALTQTPKGVQDTFGFDIDRSFDGTELDPHLPTALLYLRSLKSSLSPADLHLLLSRDLITDQSGGFLISPGKIQFSLRTRAYLPALSKVIARFIADTARAVNPDVSLGEEQSLVSWFAQIEPEGLQPR
jgi:hypothetical protein